MNHQHQENNSVPNFWSTRYAIGLIVLGGVGSLFSINGAFSPCYRCFALFIPFSVSTDAYFLCMVVMGITTRSKKKSDISDNKK